MYYLILLFIFVLFCFFFLSVFFVERTSVILAKNTWKRKTVFCIMWSNEHFTNGQRHKKKNRIIINLHLGLNRKNTFNAVRNQRQTQLPWQLYKEGQFWKDFNSMLSIGDNLVLKTKSGNCLKEAWITIEMYQFEYRLTF